MKKMAILVALLAVVATTSFGKISIGWANGGFLSGNDSSLYLTQDDATDHMIWDLVYTTRSSIDESWKPYDEANQAIDYGSDSVLSSRMWKPENGTTVKVTDVIEGTPKSTDTVIDLDYAVITDNYTYINDTYKQETGGLYAVVFQYVHKEGDLYDVYWAVTDLVVPSWNHDDQLGPDDVSFDLTDDNPLSYMGVVKEVPEPATMSLLGLGALAMVIRRKLRK